MLSVFLPGVWDKMMNNQDKLNKWFVFAFIIAVLICFATGVVKDLGENIDESYYVWILVLLALWVASVLMAIFDVHITGDRWRKLSGYKKNIYKDLWNRTPKLKVEGHSFSELSELNELYYSKFLINKKKIKFLNNVQFIPTIGTEKQYWYKKAANKMKIFWICSAVIMMVSFVVLRDKSILFGLGALGVFAIRVLWIKKVEETPIFLMKLAMRFLYDEWGWCLWYENKKRKKIKFVGRVQILELSKYHRYIYSLLDIAALGRAIVRADMADGGRRIEVMTKDIYELTQYYTEEEDKASWVDILPLWITTLFEYSSLNDISNKEVKELLKKYCENNDDYEKLKVFLEGFWLEITREREKQIENGFINKFLRVVNG